MNSGKKTCVLKHYIPAKHASHRLRTHTCNNLRCLHNHRCSSSSSGELGVNYPRIASSPCKNTKKGDINIALFMPISGSICIEINNSEIRFFIEEVIYVLKRMLWLVIWALRPSKVATLGLFM